MRTDAEFSKSAFVRVPSNMGKNQPGAGGLFNSFARSSNSMVVK